MAQHARDKSSGAKSGAKKSSSVDTASETQVLSSAQPASETQVMPANQQAVETQVIPISPEPDLSGFDVELTSPGHGFDDRPAPDLSGLDTFTEMPVARGYGDQPKYSHARGSQQYSRAAHGAHGRHASGSHGSSRNNPYSGAHNDAYGDRPLYEQAPRGFEAVKKHKSHKVLWIIGALLVILVAAYIAFAFMLDSKLAMNASSTQEELDAVLTDVAPGQPYYTLILGSDSREGSGTSTREDENGDQKRSDVMMLARIDPMKNQVTLVSIPRDTPITLDDGALVKINEAYNVGGAAESIKQVSKLTGVPISHYAEVGFSDIQAIVDSMGGVTVNVPVELSYNDALTGERVTIQPGKQKLDGQQAQIFARARHEYGTDQDANRQSSIRTLMQAMAKGVFDQPFYDIPGTLFTAAEHVGTDIRTNDIMLQLLPLAIGGDVTIYSCTGPTDGELDIYGNGLWFCYDNPDGWERIMAAVDAGEDPSGINPNG